jgi:hypothetical protein
VIWPKPKKLEECSRCLEVKPLLMPVPIAPGWPVIVWPLLCLSCRLNERSDECGTLGWDLEHHPSAETRAAYGEWLAADL